MRKALLVCALTFAAAGCGAGGQYIYQPVTPSGFVASGGPTAQYVLPATEPTGDVFLQTEGVETITNRATEITYHALHLRMTVSNREGRGVWTVDPNAQIAKLPARGWTAPFLTAIAKRTVNEPVRIAPGEKRAIDLYYALPRQASKPEQMPDFTLSWQVTLPSQVVTERTTFARQRLPLRPSSDAGDRLGVRYYDPFWQGPATPFFTPYGPFP